MTNCSATGGRPRLECGDDRLQIVLALGLNADQIALDLRSDLLELVANSFGELLGHSSCRPSRSLMCLAHATAGRLLFLFVVEDFEGRDALDQLRFDRVADRLEAILAGGVDCYVFLSQLNLGPGIFEIVPLLNFALGLIDGVAHLLKSNFETISNENDDAIANLTQTVHNLSIVHRGPAVTEFFRSAGGMSVGYWSFFGRQFRRISLFYRVLLANIAIITLGAIFGMIVSNRLWREYSDETALTIIICITAVGLGLSVLVNVLVLHAVFRPLSAMHRTALAVQSGDLAARAPINPSADPEMVRLATTFNATLDELEEDRQQLRNLAKQVVRAQEEERRRISRELHDDTAQVLFAQLLQVSALKAVDDPEVQQIAASFESSTVNAIEGVRRLALELRPPALDDLGLAAALAELIQRFEGQHGFQVDLELHGLARRLPADVELVLYRIAQEALTNVGKHAHARRVCVEITRETDNVTLIVRDDGDGFDEERYEGSDGVGLGLGLFGMQERAALIGGTLQIRSQLTSGTEITAVVPLEVPILA